MGIIRIHELRIPTKPPLKRHDKRLWKLFIWNAPGSSPGVSLDFVDEQVPPNWKTWTTWKTKFLWLSKDNHLAVYKLLHNTRTWFKNLGGSVCLIWHNCINNYMICHDLSWSFMICHDLSWSVIGGDPNHFLSHTKIAMVTPIFFLVLTGRQGIIVGLSHVWLGQLSSRSCFNVHPS